MKKILYTSLLALTLAIALIGCQKSDVTDTYPPSFCYYTWINESNHEITLSTNGLSEDDVRHFENIILPSGEQHEIMLKYPVMLLSRPGPPHKMTVLFDDRTEIVYDLSGSMLPPELYNPDYNPTLTQNYTEEEVKKPEAYLQPTGTRWTYTFTDADYEAAVKYMAGEPESELAE
jgi:hypothetical protein